MSTIKPYRGAVVRVSAAACAAFHVTPEPQQGAVERLDIRGRCPRCRHDVHYVIHEHGFGLEPAGGATMTIQSEENVESVRLDDTLRAEAADLLRRASPPDERDVTLHCDCGESHEDGKDGCGAWFSLHLAWQPDADGVQHVSVAQGPAISAYEEHAAEERDKLADTELERLRSAAGNWKNGLAALLALVPTLVVVKGTATADKLSNGDKAVVGILTAVGVLLAVVAALFALRAANGKLARAKLESDDLTADREVEADRTVAALRTTWSLTLAAVVVLAVAIGWAWQAPTSEPANFSVNLIDGSTVCGTLVGADSTAVRVKTPGGVEPIPLSKVKSVEFASSC